MATAAVRTLRIREEQACSVNHYHGGRVFLLLGPSFALTLSPVIGRSWTEIFAAVGYVLVFSAVLLVSAKYHSIHELTINRRIWQAADHCSIFVLIAAIHTLSMAIPEIGLQPKVLLTAWLFAVAGVVLKLVLLAPLSVRTETIVALIGAVAYLALGWIGLALVADCPSGFSVLFTSYRVQLLALGGAGYTASVFFFARDREGDHTIFHWIVLACGAVQFAAFV